MTAPQPGEYSPFAANYVSLASIHHDVINLLSQLKDSTYKTFTQLPAETVDYAYGPDKWTIKQMLGHMIDTERVFSYRAYCISRGDKTPFPGFEQDDYVANTDLSHRTMQGLSEEFKLLREANLAFINTLTDEQIERIGTASNHPVSVKALLYMIAGHELHHLNILKERYLK